MHSIIPSVALCAGLLATSGHAAPFPSHSSASRLSRRWFYYNNGSGLPVAAIAGIIIGVVILVLGIAVRICFISRARKRSRERSQNVAQYQGPTAMQNLAAQNPQAQGYGYPATAAPGYYSQTTAPGYGQTTAPGYAAPPYEANKAPGATGTSGAPGYAGVYTGYANGYSNDSTATTDNAQPSPAYQASVASPAPAHTTASNSYGYDSGTNTASTYQAQVYDPTSSQSSAPEIRYGK